ncbi:MAG: signal peptidase I [Deltaproteobacteria bacterium]|nr:signal peptidase I [Deltaproteobacteria bacterium]
MNSTQQPEVRFLTYTGPSMNPTLRAGDLLRVLPYDGRKVRAGDVIVFSSPEDSTKITHRVISSDSAGIQTRGDNAGSVDPWILRPDDVLGRVASAQRGRRKLRIFGGPVGQLLGVTLKGIRTVDAEISRLFYPVYDWLARSGIFRRWLKGRVDVRVVSLNRPGGKELCLLLGQRAVGRWLPGKRIAGRSDGLFGFWWTRHPCPRTRLRRLPDSSIPMGARWQ